jgi:FkbM family methyltransferase
MDFNYKKIQLGNWLYKNFFPLYNFSYRRFKLKNDKDEIELLKKLIKPGDHVLDIGANIGFYAELLSEMVGEKGRIYCFEPENQNFKHLQRNTTKLKNVVLFKNAVSNKKETIRIYTSKLLNVDHRTYPVSNYDTVEEIDAVCIDDLLQSGTIAKVNFIKIDIQGFELTAFKGMTKLLADNNHIKIITEYWPHGFRRAGTSAIEFYDFFDIAGYHFRKIENGEITNLKREFVVDNNEQPFEFSFNVLIEKKA